MANGTDFLIPVEAERALLGGLLLNGVLPDEISRMVRPRYFALDSHRKIFRAMVELTRNESPTTLPSVATLLGDRSELESVGAGYLAGLTDGLPRLADLTHYASVVEEKFCRRRFVEAGETIRAAALDASIKTADLVEQATNFLPKRESRSEPAGILLSDVQPEAVSWLWENRIPLGKITLLDGDPGVGKSMLMLDLASRLSKGDPMPGESTGIIGGTVLMTAEDGLADTVSPRLMATGADLQRVVALPYTPEYPGQKFALSITDDMAVVKEGIQRVGARLLVVDVLMSYLPAGSNSYRDQDVRLALGPLKDLAERTGVAVVCVRHLTKGSSPNPLYRGGGSIGIIGGARAGLLVARDPDDPSLVVLAQTKHNLAPPVPAITYRVLVNEDGIPLISWHGESEHTAATLLAPAEEESKGAKDTAIEFLRGFLADGPRTHKDVQLAAGARGISISSLPKYKDAAGVHSTREGFGPRSRVLWSIEGIDGNTSGVSTYEKKSSNERGLVSKESIRYESLPIEGNRIEGNARILPMTGGLS